MASKETKKGTTATKKNTKNVKTTTKKDSTKTTKRSQTKNAVNTTQQNAEKPIVATAEVVKGDNVVSQTIPADSKNAPVVISIPKTDNAQNGEGATNIIINLTQEKKKRAATPTTTTTKKKKKKKKKKKNQKRSSFWGILVLLLLLILLCVFLIPYCHKKANDNNNKPTTLWEITTDGKYMTFGSYPQRLATDAEKSTINTENVDENGYYSDSQGNKYKKLTTNASFNNEKFSDNTIIENNTEYYFKLEKITWRILKKENNTALLFSENIIDSYAYGNGNVLGVNEWLNGDFLTNFTSKEQSIMLTGTDTTNKVFLIDKTLLTQEDLFGANNYSLKRQKQTTDYARAKNTQFFDSGKGWWLYTDADKLGYVDYSGRIYNNNEILFSTGGIAPTISINLEDENNKTTTYTVKHYKQKLESTKTENLTAEDCDVDVEIEYMSSSPNTSATPSIKNYEGFTAPSTQTVTIAADGSTVVEYFYLRNSYTLTLTKGANVATISATGTYVTANTENYIVKYGATVTLSATTSTGYSFSSWSGYTVTDNSFTMPAENVSITANATTNTSTAYSVEYYLENLADSNYAKDTSKTIETTGTTGAEININTYKTEITGFEFDHFNQTSATINDDGNTIVKLYYTRKTSSLTLTTGTGIASVSASGTGVTSATSGYIVKYGATVNLSATASTGYTFNNNFTSSNVTISSNSYTHNTTENVTITATATAKVYELSYTLQLSSETYDESATVSPSSKNIEYNTAIGELPTPTRNGYTFVGWYKEGTFETEVTSETILNDSNIHLTHLASLATIYAKWSPKTYSLTYNTNGGNDITTITKTYNTAFTLSDLPTPTRDGYTFVGWYGDSSFTTKIEADDLFTNTTANTENTTATIYAKWTANTYTITFSGNATDDTISISSTSANATYDSQIGTLPTATRTGYEFDGWFIETSGTTQITATTELNSTNFATIDHTNKTLTVYAKWTACSYGANWEKDEDEHWKVCLNCNGESAHEAHSFTDGKCSVCDYIQETQNLAYTFVEETADEPAYYQVTGIGTATAKHIKIPATYNDGTNGSHPVKSIASVAFESNSQLLSIEFPNVTKLEYMAITNCNSLTKINIPAGMTEIGGTPFLGCTGVTSITVDSGNTKYRVEENCLIEIESNTIINGFSNSTIPSSVSKIGMAAFASMTTLASINIPANITEIGDIAFSGCGDLVLTVDEDNTVYHTAGNCLIETATQTLMCGFNSSVIPADNSVTSIDSYAFMFLEEIESIVIPANITLIGSYAFIGCTFTKVYYGGTETQWNAVNIKTGNTPLTTATIYYYSATQPQELNKNFWRYVDGVPTAWPVHTAHTYYDDCDTTCNVCGAVRTVTHSYGTTWLAAEDGHYHKCSNCNGESTHEAHTSVKGKCSVCDYIVETQGLSYIYDSTTESYTVNDIPLVSTIDYIRIPSTYNDGTNGSHPVKKIGFATPLTSYNTNIKSIIIPNSVTKIAMGSLLGMSELESLTIPASVTSIEEGSLSGCNSLTNIIISGNNFEFVGNCLIDVNNESVIFGAGNPTIPSDGSVTKIGAYAFYELTTLTDITIPTTITSIGNFAFASTGLTEIIIPNGIETIPQGAFKDCTSLTTVVIPSTVTTIKTEAFYGCSSLQNAYFAGTETQWNAINKQTGNTTLTSESVYFYSETEPTTIGKYWHYVEGVATPWAEKMTYTVKYYMQNIADNDFTEDTSRTVTATGTTGTTATITAEYITGFTFDSTKSSNSGTIEGDGSLVLKLYYNRRVGQLFITKGTGIASVTATGDSVVKFNETDSQVDYNVRYGAEVTLTATASDGYTFSGWTVASSSTATITDNKLIQNTANVINITATATANTYSLTYNTNGGNDITAVNKTYNTAFTSAELPTNLTKTGYTFVGWYKDSSLTTEVEANNLFTTSNATFANVATASTTATIYAKWTENTYTISFNGNGNTSGTMSNITGVDYTEEKTLPTNTFVKTGYVFLGWSTVQSAVTESYSDGATVSKLTATNNATIVLYAIWAISGIDEPYTRVDEDGNPSDTGNYVLFGHYPQTVATSTELASITATNQTDTDGYHLDADGNRYKKFNANPYISSNSDFQAKFGNGEIITSGTAYYFKLEPIKWRILTTNNGKAYLLAEDILYAHRYYETADSTRKQSATSMRLIDANDYKSSEIRAWLNGYSYTGESGTVSTYLNTGFLQTAFTTAESNIIQSTSITENSSTMSDKVFLIKYNDLLITSYGFPSTTYQDATRVKQSTDYSVANYLLASDGFGAAWWWTRTKYQTTSVSDTQLHYVSRSGNLDYGIDVDDKSVGVVPAIWIDLGTTYRLTYETNGGNSLPIVVKSYNSAYKTSELPTPTKTGYTFVGWYKDSSLTTEVEVGDLFTTATATFTSYGTPNTTATIYAKWTENTYTIAFNNNGGTGEMASLTSVTYTENKTLTTNTFTKTGCAFVGWSEDQNATTKTYDNGATVTGLTAENGATVTLYAIWHEHNYSWDYNSTNHWQVCSVCDATTNTGTHSYGADGLCTTCGRSQLEIEYNTETETYTVTGVGDFTGTTLAIPSTYNDGTNGKKSVTSIDYNAFKDEDSITSVSIPASITNINSGAFRDCSGLTSLTVDEDNSVYHIINNCIIETATKTLWVGSNNATIPTDSSVVTSIGDAAFSDRVLTSITIPSNITSIGAYAFCLVNLETSLTIPGNVETVGPNAFSYCKITSLTLQEGVKTLQLQAFFLCEKLESISLPASLESMSGNVFSYSSRLAEITLAEGNTKFVCINNCLIKTATKTLVTGCKNSIIPTDANVVTSIGNQAFYGANIHSSSTNVKSITIPANITSISSEAFSISGFESIVFAENSSLNSLGNYCFSNCQYLTSFTIPDGVTTIGYRCFLNCYSLTTLVIPTSVTSIGSNLLLGVTGVSIYYAGTQAEWDEMTVDSDNTNLNNATKYYYSETQPTDTTGNYWHYVSDVPTAWTTSSSSGDE